MASKNLLEVLTEYEDGALIYKCTIAGKTKLAKYTGMKLWLKGHEAVEMQKSLDRLHWLLELSTVEKALCLEDPVSLKKILSLSQK